MKRRWRRAADFHADWRLQPYVFFDLPRAKESTAGAAKARQRLGVCGPEERQALTAPSAAPWRPFGPPASRETPMHGASVYAEKLYPAAGALDSVLVAVQT